MFLEEKLKIKRSQEKEREREEIGRKSEKNIPKREFENFVKYCLFC